MADITIKAAYGSVVEDEGRLFVGFAEGEDADEGYVLFSQSLEGGPIWFEVNDEGFGAEDAVEAVTAGQLGVEILLKAGMAATFGWARTVAVRIGPGCEDSDLALEALWGMLGGLRRD
jgi:hypothetical protein